MLTTLFAPLFVLLDSCSACLVFSTNPLGKLVNSLFAIFRNIESKTAETSLIIVRSDAEGLQKGSKGLQRAPKGSEGRVKMILPSFAGLKFEPS